MLFKFTRQNFAWFSFDLQWCGSLICLILILYVLQLWIVDALDVLSVRILFSWGHKFAVELYPPPVNVIGSTGVLARWR